MSRTANVERRDLVGRRIVDVEFNRRHMGAGYGWTTDPVLVLDTGRRIVFIHEEGDGEYGIRMLTTRRPRPGEDPDA